MYGWIWRHLPGGAIAKLIGAIVLIIAVVALLFLVIFPWIGPALPFSHATVNVLTPPGPT
jgi:hypothetical protein